MQEIMRDVYLNPYTDFGFKRLFGSELNKELLISFLNALLQGKEDVVDVTYLNPEKLGWNKGSRRAVFDVYCRNSKGDFFIVEMQKAYQRFFKDRSVFYSTFPIQEQASKGDWDYKLKNVYTIGVLNFVFPNDEYSPDCFHHEVKLMDVADKHVFYDKLTFIYLEVPKFNKTEDELETMFDKWMFVFKNLSNLLNRPAALQERVFTRLFEQAKISEFNETERLAYIGSLKVYRDMNNVIRTAEENKYAEGLAEGLAEGEKKGRAEGRAEVQMEVVRKMKAQNIPPAVIAACTGLSEDEINSIKY